LRLLTMVSDYLSPSWGKETDQKAKIAHFQKVRKSPISPIFQTKCPKKISIFRKSAASSIR